MILKFIYIRCCYRCSVSIQEEFIVKGEWKLFELEHNHLMAPLGIFEVKLCVRIEYVP